MTHVLCSVLLSQNWTFLNRETYLCLRFWPRNWRPLSPCPSLLSVLHSMYLFPFASRTRLSWRASFPFSSLFSTGSYWVFIFIRGSKLLSTQSAMSLPMCFGGTSFTHTMRLCMSLRFGPRSLASFLYLAHLSSPYMTSRWSPRPKTSTSTWCLPDSQLYVLRGL